MRIEMTEKIIGILGGMGPEATADLFYRIVKGTPVKKDQDHPRTIIFSNSKVPDRTPAIVGDGESPLPEMRMAARKLEAAGADFIVIPCNTAHHFIDSLQESIQIPILHMIKMTAKRVKEIYPLTKKVGLIATNGTLKSRIYEHFFNATGMEILVPTESNQEQVMDAIYNHIKVGNLDYGRKLSLEISRHLISCEADLIVCGCTEISLVLKNGDLDVPVVDPMQVLAETAILVALNKLDFSDVD
jgi:aspartate racemase